MGVPVIWQVPQSFSVVHLKKTILHLVQQGHSLLAQSSQYKKPSSSISQVPKYKN